ncbi:PhoH family protein [Sanyastnella coralliicola]|uniref:PhoH family protein n=1 Tax=Sanyastnella coralliicola TaxID=3069118 RepID=UPI0027BA00C9|nr:PhoH family protein [Longitalea sp. SCSIO 12813]
MDQEKEISIPLVDPLVLFGANNSKFKLIKSYFPKLKIVARGSKVKVLGAPEEIERFEKKLELVLWHIEKYQRLTERNIERLMQADNEEVKNRAKDEDVLVYGPGGIKVTARTPNQRRLVKAVEDNDMVFAIGPAGTGKTYTAVALAVRALKEKEVRRIILTRPAVEAGENLGFLPGDLKEKLDPYMQPLYDGLTDMLPYEKVADYIEKGVIEVAPLAFMRGRTLDKAFVILDEAQNATVSQMKMFLTRMGQSAKFIITGDVSQVDLPRKQPSGLLRAVKILDNKEGISIIRLGGEDIIRHKLVTMVINAFEHDEKEREAYREAKKQEKKEANDEKKNNEE